MALLQVVNLLRAEILLIALYVVADPAEHAGVAVLVELTDEVLFALFAEVDFFDHLLKLFPPL